MNRLLVLLGSVLIVFGAIPPFLMLTVSIDDELPLPLTSLADYGSIFSMAMLPLGYFFFCRGRDLPVRNNIAYSLVLLPLTCLAIAMAVASIEFTH